MFAPEILLVGLAVALICAVARRGAGRDAVPVPEMIARALSRLAEGDTDVRLAVGRAGAESRVASLVNTLAGELADVGRAAAGHASLAGNERDAPRGYVTVAALGIDRFAKLRQQIGSPLAHRTLKLIQSRIIEAEPEVIMGRLGRAGVEFMLPVTDPAGIDDRLSSLQATIEQPIRVDGQHFELSTTIGYAVCPNGRLGEAAMTERAELALDRALATHLPLARFGVDDEIDSSDRLALGRDLGSAVERGEFFLCYQPKLACRDNSIAHVEALIRWRHPTRGVVAPDEFITLAESTGTIRSITRWVLETAVTDQARLAAQGFDVEISVNISGRLLGDAGFAHWALDTVRAANGPICFEITETSVIADPDRAVAQLDTFARAGIRIAIDDYGSGLSSLAYLKRLPAHELKIDKLFISGLASSQRDPLLVRSTIDLAHALGLKVTAEGVDSPAAFALMRMMGCDHAQGFLIARPAAFDDLVRFLTDHRSRADEMVSPQSPFRTAFFKKA